MDHPQGVGFYWSCAHRLQVNGKSGGTLILVRKYLQSWIPKEATSNLGGFWAHWACAVVVSAGGLGPVLCVSCYLYTNSFAKAKLVAPNMRFLSALGDFIKMCALPVIIGADWKLAPNVLCSSPFLEEFGLAVKWDESALGSCVTHGGSSVSSIDFFVVSRHLAAVVSDCSFCPFTPPRPHRPIYLVFRSKPRNVQVCVFKDPPNLPTDLPFGPKVPPSDWQPTADFVDSVCSRSGCRDDGGHYAETSEEDLGDGRCPGKMA